MAKWLVQKSASTGRYIVMWQDGCRKRGYVSNNLAHAVHGAYEGWSLWHRVQGLRNFSADETVPFHVIL